MFLYKKGKAGFLLGKRKNGRFARGISPDDSSLHGLYFSRHHVWHAHGDGRFSNMAAHLYGGHRLHGLDGVFTRRDSRRCARHNPHAIPSLSHFHRGTLAYMMVLRMM